ncbi:MAG TPA: site-specific DNA-methyltransferase [Dyadobacter sp.]|jgi:DNA modification methylase|nr:site-specific DNA-methyltransferase [Dyadobacter sp.]
MKIKEISNKIFNSDARNLLDFIGDSTRIKSTITSPPYYDMKDYGSENQIGFGQSYDDYLEDLKIIFSDIFKITDDDGSLWIVIDSFKRDNQVITLPFDLSNKLKETGWLLQDIIIWKKDKTVPWSSNGFIQRKFEYILFFTKTKKFKYNKDRVRNFDTDQLKKWWVKYPERYNPKGKALDEIWEFPIPVQGSWGEKYIRHFCPLPKEMVATMIEISTDPNDLVLDPFAGSGSVLFQSTVMSRRYIGFELNESYIQMFNNYLQSNEKISKKEYSKLQEINDQEGFRNRILNLRALKYARLLINDIEKEFRINLKVFVKIISFSEQINTHLEVEYTIIGGKEFYSNIVSHINVITKKAPLSKFGIKPTINIVNKIHLDESKHYKYTKSNSHSYSSLPLDSHLVKVISEICVNLNEKDYN